MKSAESLFRVSGRGIVLTIVMGCASAWAAGSMALAHNPQQAFSGAEGIVWVMLGPLCLMAFILGAGATLTIYFACNLLRALVADNSDSA